MIRVLTTSLLTRVTLLVFALLFASYAAFASGLYNYNTMSRIGLTANFVQHGRLDIDGYDKLTHDKAYFNGHYYSDKAPGMSFLAMPIAYLYTRAAPVEPNVDLKGADASGRRLSMLIYLSTLMTSGLLTAIAGAALFSYVATRTGSLAAGLISALAYGLATPTWEWATSFFGHAAAGALLIIGFIALDRLAREPAWTRTKIAIAALSGAAFGAAITIEFTGAIAIAILLLCYVAQGLSDKRAPRDTIVDVVAVGAVIALMQIPLLVYNNAIFGSPFHLGYSNVVGFNGMKSGFFGINAPDPFALWQILFSFFRGIVWLSPMLVFAAIGAGVQARRADMRWRAAAIIGVTLFYLLLNAGYAYWDGGSSTGPRHITPIYPFLALALGLWYAHGARHWRGAILAALGVSLFISLACVAVETMTPTTVPAPLTDLILPNFLKGDLPQSMVQIVTHRKGLWQLAPIAALWIGLGWVIGRELKRAPAP